MGISKLAETIRPQAPRRSRLRRVVLPALIVIGFLLLTSYDRPQSKYVLEFHGDAQLTQFQWDRFDAQLQKCEEYSAPSKSYEFPVPANRTNPRWNAISGQSKTTVLRNVTLFDGDVIHAEPVDIVFQEGVIKSISSSSNSATAGYFQADNPNTVIHNYNGDFVTPGLVDMHSHHLALTWPELKSTGDENEVNDETGPLTPFVRSLDSLKPYDIAATIIAAGGVTTSLILPGSANIIGGEAYPVKNFLRGGEHGEEIVEELLLEHGIPKEDRRRYLKMACGENPRRVYKHTRMGNAWKLRQHLARAKDLQESQDAWCAAASTAKQNRDAAAVANLLVEGGLSTKEMIEYSSTFAMFTGNININVHCYEPEDIEDVLLHSAEFGFRINAFHHALSAWKVPELIKSKGQNITVATFADFSLYKKEGYDGNLHAGKVLHEHGVPIAYKSDHVDENTNARYLISQAATGHSFGLPEILALQSVTSVPARSLELHHRVGYVKPGYDADIVVWNSHPLSAGAWPLQVYIDGKSTLDEKVNHSKGTPVIRKPIMRPEAAPEDIKAFCSSSASNDETVIINGISTSYLQNQQIKQSSTEGNLTMVITNGKIECLGERHECDISPQSAGKVISLQNGYVLPGLTTVSSGLGLVEISSEGSTQDGSGDSNADIFNPESALFAKYGIHFEGKAFDRARLGGVTRSITYPETSGFLKGVSVGIKTAEGSNPLNGGIFKDDIALHVVVGQDAKGSSQTPTVSKSVASLRKILSQNKGETTIYGKAADGKIPVVVHTENKYDILQVIKIKQDFPKTKLVIYGAAEAPSVADEIAAADIPLIFTGYHSAPSTWEKKGLLVGPPLTISPVQVLVQSNVTFGLALLPDYDWHLANLPIEAAAIAKEAGLGAQKAVDLFSVKIDDVLGFEGTERNTDFVIWEGDPLEYGSNAVLAVENNGPIIGCWPQAE